MMNILNYPKDQKGFTILELIIASTVFSTIMLLATTGLIQIGRTYHKGQITAKTQEVTRSVSEEISREVQFSNEPIVPASVKSYGSGGVEVQSFCIGNIRYTKVINQPELKQGVNDDIGNKSIKHLVWADKKAATATCVTIDNLSGADPSTGRDLLSQNMRLVNLDVTQNGDDVNVSLKIYYGDYDLTEPDTLGFCESSKTGGQFCAQSELNTVVRRRI